MKIRVSARRSQPSNHDVGTPAHFQTHSVCVRINLLYNINTYYLIGIVFI
jgi:hypothetical protein